ncbi:MAG: glycosyltransferase family 4 protein [Thermomicrobia bacterium]|nr:glycosyltransferase family 4 protein [Thermomicrobia bacterium]MCA1724990.1 glycosyltransferase family 4 protein [Thermomicrobia bacterium]
MKVALVSPYDVRYPGGVADHIHHLSGVLRTMGHHVTVIAPAGSGNEDDFVVGQDFYGIGRAVKFPANGSSAWITLQPFALTKPVKEVLRAEKFDVIHLHEPLMPNLPHIILRHSTSINVGTFHAFSESNMGYATFRPYLRRDFRTLHGRIAVSRAAKAYVQSYFPGRVVVVPNGIEPGQFGPQVAPFPQYCDGRPTILFVGRYNDARKGFKYLTRAIALVRLQYPDVRLLVVGRGQPKRYLRFIESHGLARNVDFVGFATAEELPRYYASADLFCSPATGRESFGLVVMEAMASGTPVVTTTIPGHLGILTNGVEGLMVEPASAQALALAMTRLLADRSLARAMGEAGRATAMQYSWVEVGKRVVEQYEQAAKVRQRLASLSAAPR